MSLFASKELCITSVIYIHIQVQPSVRVLSSVPIERVRFGPTKMEGVKFAAAHLFCTDSGLSLDEVYNRVRSVAGDARRFYADGEA